MKVTTTPITEDTIRAIAYSLWLEDGCPEGRAEHHWFKANEIAVQTFAIPALEVAKPKRKAPAKKAK
jgi:hypothetical protein